MAGTFIIWIIVGMVVFFFILHYVIQGALDSSQTAKNIKEVRDLLNEFKHHRKSPHNENENQENVEKHP